MIVSDRPPNAQDVPSDEDGYDSEGNWMNDFEGKYPGYYDRNGNWHYFEEDILKLEQKYGVEYSGPEINMDGEGYMLHLQQRYERILEKAGPLGNPDKPKSKWQFEDDLRFLRYWWDYQGLDVWTLDPEEREWL